MQKTSQANPLRGWCFGSAIVWVTGYSLSLTCTTYLSFMHFFYTYKLHETAETRRRMCSRQDQAVYSFTRTAWRKHCLIYTLPRIIERQEVQMFSGVNVQCASCHILCVYMSLLLLVWVGENLGGSQESSFMWIECSVYVFYICFIHSLYMQHSLQSVSTSRIFASWIVCCLTGCFYFQSAVDQCFYKI